MVKLTTVDQLNDGELVITDNGSLCLLLKRTDALRQCICLLKTETISFDKGQIVDLASGQVVVHIGKLVIDPQDNGSFACKVTVPKY